MEVFSVVLLVHQVPVPVVVFADGYVEDAFVFFDIDGDQEYDVGESFAYTDENGFYEIENTPTGNYTIVAQGGIDVDSGEVIDVLYAPSDASMVTPLTTLSHLILISQFRAMKISICSTTTQLQL